jgi:hypothetical protein
MCVAGGVDWACLPPPASDRYAYALIDLPDFLNGVTYEVQHNVVLGHTGYEGNTFGWYAARLLGSSERWITLLSLAALILATVRRQWRVWWLAVFPLLIC